MTFRWTKLDTFGLIVAALLFASIFSYLRGYYLLWLLLGALFIGSAVQRERIKRQQDSLHSDDFEKLNG